MKKIALILLSTLVFVGCVDKTTVEDTKENNNVSTEVVTESGETKKDDKSSVNVISANEVVEKIKRGGAYAFVLGNENCSACMMYRMNLFELKEYKFDYVDIAYENEESLRTLLIDTLNIENIEEGVSTPTTYFIKDGEVVDTIVGAVSAKEVMHYFGDFIKEIQANEGPTPEKNVQLEPQETEELPEVIEDTEIPGEDNLDN